MDIGHKRKDHYPAAARIMLSTKSSACPARRRRPCYDRTAVADKGKAKEFCDTAHAFHRIPFKVEPTIHCHLDNLDARSFGCLLRTSTAVRSSAPRQRCNYELYWAKMPSCKEGSARGHVLKERTYVLRIKCGRGSGVRRRFRPSSALLRVTCAKARRVSLVRALGDIDLQVILELLAHLDKAADRATVAMASGNQYAMHAAVRSVMPRKPRAYRRIKCADGSPAPSFVAERRRFRAYFAELLGGDEMSLEALV